MFYKWLIAVSMSSILMACGADNGENATDPPEQSSESRVSSSSEAQSSSSSSSALSSSSSSKSSVSSGSGDQPNFSLVGYANEGAQVTGGQGSNPTVLEYSRSALRDALFDDAYLGGIILYLDNGADIHEALSEQERHQRQMPNDPPKPLTIYVTGKITHANSGTTKIDMKRQSHVSIIGVGDKGEWDGIGITLNGAENVIIRNLMIHHVNIGSSTAIEVTNDSKNIWITQNEFYAAGLFYHDDGSINDSYKDDYDGLVDIKRGSKNITVSWNIFRDHYKGLLLGHDDNASLAPDNLTYHHNYFYNIKSRLPLTRFAQVHMFNNYFHKIQDTAINARMGARILVENNYFEDVGTGTQDGNTGYVKGPIGHYYGSPDPGYWHVMGNILVDSPDDHMQSTDPTITVPYDYQHVLHNAQDVPDIVTTHAGRTYEMP